MGLWRCARPLFKAHRRYQKWLEARKHFHAEVWETIQSLEEDEQFDFNELDENGDPVKKDRLTPKFIRLRWQFFLFVYYDPFMEALEHAPSIWRFLRVILAVAPVVAFAMSLGWLGYSVYRNFEYLPGDCVVDELPASFSTGGTTAATVSGTYTVKRFYDATEYKPQGYVIQTCNVEIECQQLDFRDDGRCASFQLWAWGESLECFYHKDDFHGKKNAQLYCLDRPSKLERESFTIAVAGCVLMLTGCFQGIWIVRRREIKKQEEIERRQAQAQELEDAEARRIIEEREAEDARKSRESEAGDEDGDSRSQSTVFMPFADDEGDDED